MIDDTEPMSHEDAEELNAVEGYLLDDLTEDQRLRFEAHYFECQTCAEAIAAAQMLLESIRYPEPWWKRVWSRLRW